MARALVTRRVLARELVLNAALRPLNVGVTAGVVVAAFLLALWLLPVAALVYVALVLTTVFDGDIAESVGREVYARARRGLPRGERTDLTPAVAEKLSLAHAAQHRIHKAVDESRVPLPDVEVEVDRLMNELEKLARQADRVTTYLAEENEAALRRRLERLRRTESSDPQLNHANAQAAAALEDQLDARAQLSRQLLQFDAQMEHIAATLGVIHAQIVRMNVAEEGFAQGRVLEQVRDLRHEVDAAADALHEAYRELE